MSKSVTSPYDVEEHLRTPEEMAAYLEASMEEADGDAAFIAKALGDLARAKGMSQVACDAGLSRESLYKALSGDRNPSLDTFLRVVGALGLRLRAEAVQGPEEAGTGRIGASLTLGDESRCVARLYAAPNVTFRKEMRVAKEDV